MSGPKRQSESPRLTDTDWPAIPVLSSGARNIVDTQGFNESMSEWQRRTQDLWNKRIAELEKRIAELESGT